jgi:hypothetical protein
MFIVAAVLASPPAAHAQGHGRPKTPRAPTTPAATTQTSTSAPSPIANAPLQTATPSTSFRQFGSWLDDASVAARGDGFTSVTLGYWRMAGTSQTDLPMMSAGVGITDRAQLTASVPFYQTSSQGTSTRGLDDVYISAKYNLLDPTLTISEVGLAVSPVVEVLSGVPDDRLHFAIPVTLEIRRRPFRTYGSVGYFTRGALFSGGALEWTSVHGVTLTGSMTHSYSAKNDVMLDQLAVSRQRADVSFGVGYPLTRTAATSVSIGRSLTSVDQGGTSLALSGGVSFTFAAAASRP